MVNNCRVFVLLVDVAKLAGPQQVPANLVEKVIRVEVASSGAKGRRLNKSIVI